MGRRPIAKARRINLSIDEKVAKMLDAHRARLIKDRGVNVTESDAVRDAIVRTGR